MSDYQKIQLRNGVEIETNDELLVTEALPETDLAPDIDAGTVLTVDRIVFDDDDFESGFAIVVTEDNGWIHAYGVADLMSDDHLVVAKQS